MKSSLWGDFLPWEMDRLGRSFLLMFFPSQKLPLNHRVSILGSSRKMLKISQQCFTRRDEWRWCCTALPIVQTPASLWWSDGSFPCGHSHSAGMLNIHQAPGVCSNDTASSWRRVFSWNEDQILLKFSDFIWNVTQCISAQAVNAATTQIVLTHSGSVEPSHTLWCCHTSQWLWPWWTSLCWATSGIFVCKQHNRLL